jgi:pimeloyl-ACP methyl ester carboxylesterase
MSTEEFALTVDERTIPARLDVPDDPDERGVVVLPGGNHGPYGDVFGDFAGAATAEGHRVLRYESWGEAVDPDEQKTLAAFHEEFQAAVAELFDRGCSRVDAVAKSFGGAVALHHLPADVESAVLWAPAPSVVDDVDRDDLLTRPMADLEFVDIDADALAEFDAPALVVYGDDDPIPEENFDRILDGLPDAEGVVLEGGDHSFEGVEAETVAHTLAFLAAR